MADTSRKSVKRTGGGLRKLAFRGALYAGAALAGRAVLRNLRAISFEGRVALVTGGSRGLGLCIARELVRAGASVAICARDSEELDRAAQELRGIGGEVHTVVCDLTDEADIQRMIADVAERFGRLDVLINNAGVITVGPMSEMTDEDYELAMQTHFWAPLHCTVHALPWLRKTEGGRIVNVASIGGLTSIPHLLPYSASKYALVGLSEGLRAELAKEGITVTTACPGLMRTGSNLHALFKGQNRKEYSLFTLFGVIPGNSVDAQAAARKIVDACRVGDANVVIGLPSKFGALVHGIFPGLTADLWSVVNRVLPGEGGIGRASVTGKESETDLTRSPLTAPIRRAEVEHNEV